MLLRIATTEIEQRCDHCGAKQVIQLDELRAGVEIGEPASPLDPNVVGLPVCPGCGSKEFLIRVARAPSGSDQATVDHRRGVNALHPALVASGRVAATLAPYFASESFEIEAATIPWTFGHEPVPAVLATATIDPTVAAFAAFLAANKDGG